MNKKTQLHELELTTLIRFQKLKQSTFTSFVDMHKQSS